MKLPKIISITATRFWRLLLSVLGTDCGGSEIKEAYNRANVVVGQSSAGESASYLLAHHGKSHLRKFPVIDGDRLNKVNEDACENVRASNGIVESAGLRWRHWAGSCWEPDDIAPSSAVNATPEGGAVC